MTRPAWRLALLTLSLFSLLIATTVGAQPTELFISEYIEGSSNNKAIEIYNGTGVTIDLAAGSYSLAMYFNGSTSALTTINLTGTVAAGDVYVVAHSSAVAAILAEADQTSGASFYNGDDAIVLRKGAVAIDSIGQVGFDPGSQWGTGLTSTQDNTLRRKVTVCAGDTDSSDAFDPATEWDGYAQDTYDDLGAYAGCRQPLINEFSASTTGVDVEYVEILGTPNADLSGFTVLEIEGDSTGQGTIDEVISLGTAGANGYYLASLAANTLENGSVSLLLVEGFSGSFGTDIDTNNDGTFDSTPWTRIVDSIAVNDGGASDLTYGTTTLSVSYDSLPFAPGGASRYPNGIDTDTTGDWVRNDFDLAGISAGTPVDGEAYNTPGAVNEIVVEMAPEVSSTTPANGGTAPVTVSPTVTFSEAVDVTAGAFTLECPAGTPVTFTVSPSLPATGATVFTIDPTASLPVSVTCTATVLAANVTDSDASDPPDAMAADYSWTFDTLGETAIHTIQGSGTSSPFAGSVVLTTGVVTGVKSNGFFIQEPDATVDADPFTSEGIFVYTGGAPPAAATVGNLVEVTGTVSEYVPSSDLYQPPLTELISPSVNMVSAANPLPTPIELTTTFPDPAASYDQLESLEGMRVSVPSMTVVGPTVGNINEPNATATTTGVFFGTVTGVARPFREAGIQPPDPAPSGSIPPIPRFDGNPEVIRVDSDGLNGTSAIDVGAGATIANVIGPLDYGFRRYTILPESTLVPAGGPADIGATAPVASEFTVASYNLERFFDDVNDPSIGEPVLTTSAYDFRRTKASLHIRDYLSTPDIVGVIEVENLTTLQALAAQINSDAVSDSQPDPNYVAYLVEGNDVGGIDVGFLVKTAEVDVAVPRVEVVSVTQELAGSLFTYPDSFTELLNDRPPLMLRAIIHHPNGSTYPVTVIVNHLRSLNGVDDEGAGTHGFATGGERVRAKRLAQAVDLANFVQNLQTTDPTENIVLVGDFNAFDVNDGYVDSMSTIAGNPVPDNETAVPGDGVDLVDPDLSNLGDLVAAVQRYGYVFEGNAQNLDHILVNSALVSSTLTRRIEHPRVNSDFPEVDYAGSTTRLSDHDPVVAYFQISAFASVHVTKTVTGVGAPGAPIQYVISIENSGSAAQLDNLGDELIDVLPSSLALISATATSGSAVATVATNTVTWNGSIPAGGTVAVTISAQIDLGVTLGQVIANQATASYDADGNGTNESPAVSDDPGTAAMGDPTELTIITATAFSASIPVFDGVGRSLLIFLVAIAGVVVLRRQVS